MQHISADRKRIAWNTAVYNGIAKASLSAQSNCGCYARPILCPSACILCQVDLLKMPNVTY